MLTTPLKSEAASSDTRNIRLPQGFRDQTAANNNQLETRLSELEAENSLLRARNRQLHQQISELWVSLKPGL